jgi:competence ComEA-like helix-hairpin-helix protein
VWLTPAERRGILVLVAILLLGTGWDLWQASPWRPQRTPYFAAADSFAAQAVISPPARDLRDSTRVALDLNRATAAALDALPGIGPVLAGRIVAHRERLGPYRRPEDLLEVPGIGPRLLERLRPLVSAEGSSSSARPMQSAKQRPHSHADSASAADSSFR